MTTILVDNNVPLRPRLEARILDAYVVSAGALVEQVNVRRKDGHGIGEQAGSSDRASAVGAGQRDPAIGIYDRYPKPCRSVRVTTTERDGRVARAESNDCSDAGSSYSTPPW